MAASIAYEVSRGCRLLAASLERRRELEQERVAMLTARHNQEKASAAAIKGVATRRKNQLQRVRAGGS